MRKLDLVGLLCVVTLPGVALAQARGEEPAEIDPNAPVAENPRDVQPAEPAEPADGRGDEPGMSLIVSGVSEIDGALTVKGASGLKAGEGSLAVLGGRLNMGLGGRRVVLHNHAQVGDGGRAVINEGSTVIVDGDLAITNRSSFQSDNGTILVNGGSILSFDRGSSGRLGRGSSAVFNGESALALSGGSGLTVNGGGNIEFNDRAYLVGDGGSTFTVKDGSLVLTDSSRLSLEGSNISITGGDLLINDHATMNFDQVTIVVSGDVIFSGTSDSVFESSSINVNGGNFEVHDNAGVTINDSDLLLHNASLDTNFAVLLQGRASGEAHNSSINIRNGGSLLIGESFNLTGRNSTLSVEGGNLEFSDLARLDAACNGDAKVASVRGKAVLSCVRDARNDDEAAQCAGGFFDERSGRWKCEDTCLKLNKNSTICGTTDHL